MSTIKRTIKDIVEEEIATVRGSWVWGRTRNGGNDKKPGNHLNNNQEVEELFKELIDS